MPRLRIIKPSFWSHSKTGNLPDKAKLLLMGVMNYADDEGIVEIAPHQLKSVIFPYDAEISPGDIEGHFQALSDAGLVLIYERNRQKYAWIIWFRAETDLDNPLSQRIEKPKPPRYPTPRTDNQKFTEAVMLRDHYRCHKCKSFYDLADDPPPEVKDVAGKRYPSDYISLCGACCAKSNTPEPKAGVEKKGASGAQASAANGAGATPLECSRNVPGTIQGDPGTILAINKNSSVILNKDKLEKKDNKTVLSTTRAKNMPENVVVSPSAKHSFSLLRSAFPDLSKETAQAIANVHRPSYIQHHITIVLWQVEHGTLDVRSPEGLLIRQIAFNWKPPKAYWEFQRARAVTEQKMADLAAQQAVAVEEAKRQKAYDAMMMAALDDMAPEERQAILEMAEELLKGNVIYNRYNQCRAAGKSWDEMPGHVQAVFKTYLFKVMKDLASPDDMDSSQIRPP